MAKALSSDVTGVPDGWSSFSAAMPAGLLDRLHTSEATSARLLAGRGEINRRAFALLVISDVRRGVVESCATLGTSS